MQSHYCVAVFFVFCQNEKQKKRADAIAPAQYKNTADVIKYHQPYKFCIVDCSHYEKARRTNTQHQKTAGLSQEPQFLVPDWTKMIPATVFLCLHSVPSKTEFVWQNTRKGVILASLLRDMYIIAY